MTRVVKPDDEDAAKIDEVIAGLRKRMWLIAFCSLFFGVGLTVLAFWMTPIYRGSVILAPANTDRSGLGGGLSSALGSMGGGLAALAGIGFSNNDSATEEALAVIRSKQFTETFIEENKLMPELFPKQWNQQTGRWKDGLKKTPTLARGFQVFDRVRTVTKDSKTGLITFEIEWKDRVKAAAWANGMVERLNSEMRTRASVEADASLGYLQKENANTVDVSTREAISRLIENQVKQKMLANVTQQYSLRFVDRAMIPDADDPAKPKKVLFAALGLLFGGVVGTAIALVLHKRELFSRSDG